MQILVYTFVFIAALAIGGAAYFGLTFTLIESALLAVVALCFAMMMMERTLRTRAERRMEKGIEDLSRLLSTDAQAGQVLSQRINALADANLSARLEVLEADISVMGTVVRQVAEVVSDIETRTAPTLDQSVHAEDEMPSAPVVDRAPEPAIPLPMLRDAIEDNRLVFHAQSIITLPQRRAHGYDLVPRLALEDGEIADAPEFMPIRGGQDVVRRIERQGVEEAVAIVRRARTVGQPMTLYVPISRAILSDRDAAEDLVGLFEANRVVAPSLVLRMIEREWRAMNQAERAVVADIHGKGIAFALTGSRTLRLDFNELAVLGVSSVRVEAEHFVGDAASLTDFHAADVAAYISRFGVDLVVENIKTEQHVLTVLEDGVHFAQGPHIGAPAPVRNDLMVRRDLQPAAARVNTA